MGLLVRLSTNGSTLSDKKTLRLLHDLPPTRIAVSLYGASEETYESLTRTSGQGIFKKFIKGLHAAKEAKLPIRLKIILTQHNEKELDAMNELAESFGFEYHVYGRLSATLKGDKSVLKHQASNFDLRTTRPPFKGCKAGNNFFHVDPLGMASICMSGRDSQIDLINEGLKGLEKMPQIAEDLLTLSGSCSNCSISNTCATCPLMVKSYRKAGAKKAYFCNFEER